MKTAVAGAFAFLTSLWGWFGWLVVVWVLLMLADWTVGSALACKNGCWSSTRLREGTWHKVGMVLTFLVSLIADWLISFTLTHLPVVQLPFSYTVLLAPLVLVWYIVGELGSLAEHAVSTGAPVPRWLVRLLKISHKAIDAAGEQLSAGSGSEDEKD